MIPWSWMGEQRQLENTATEGILHNKSQQVAKQRNKACGQNPAGQIVGEVARVEHLFPLAVCCSSQKYPLRTGVPLRQKAPHNEGHLEKPPLPLPSSQTGFWLVGKKRKAGKDQLCQLLPEFSHQIQTYKTSHSCTQSPAWLFDIMFKVLGRLKSRQGVFNPRSALKLLGDFNPIILSVLPSSQGRFEDKARERRALYAALDFYRDGQDSVISYNKPASPFAHASSQS